MKILLLAFGFCFLFPVLHADERLENAKKTLFSAQTPEEDRKNALATLRLLAETGDTEAEYWYAWMRHYGKGGMPAAKPDAFRFSSLAAGKNHPRALYRVGY